MLCAEELDLYASFDLALLLCFSYEVGRSFFPRETTHALHEDCLSFSSYSYCPPCALLPRSDCALDSVLSYDEVLHLFDEVLHLFDKVTPYPSPPPSAILPPAPSTSPPPSPC